MKKNMGLKILLLLILGILSVISEAESKSRSALWLVNEDKDYDKLLPKDQLPEITSQSEIIKAAVGDAVTLPCHVRRLGDHSVNWKTEFDGSLYVIKGHDSSHHTQSTGNDSNITLNDTSLVIKQVSLRHSGNYLCEVVTTEERVQHQLIVQERPSAWISRSIIVINGSRAELECNITGIPPPTITWKRENKILKRNATNKLVIEKVIPSDEAIYTCIADNGVGSPAEAQTVLNVAFAPVIAINEQIVYSGINFEARLYCDVFASPSPKVKWYKNGTFPLDFQSHKLNDTRYYLLITPTTHKNFGEYICHAKNFWGNATGVVELTGRPRAPLISLRRGSHSGDFHITWSVESYSAIASYDVFYKTSDADEWANITVPGYSSSSWFYNQQYTLKGIPEDLNITVKIKARNEFGDSEWSNIYDFYIGDDDIKSVTRRTVHLDTLDYEVSEIEALSNSTDEEVLPQIVGPAESIVGSFAAQNGSDNSTASSGHPNLTPAQKKAQMVALLTAISLSSFFS